MWAYGVRHFGESVADSYLDTLLLRTEDLKTFPRAYPAVVETPIELRRMSHRGSIVLYRIMPNLIRVERVSDGRRDISAIIEEIIR